MKRHGLAFVGILALLAGLARADFGPPRQSWEGYSPNMPYGGHVLSGPGFGSMPTHGPGPMVRGYPVMPTQHAASPYGVSASPGLPPPGSLPPGPTSYSPSPYGSPPSTAPMAPMMASPPPSAAHATMEGAAPCCPPVGVPPGLPGYLAFGAEVAFLNPHVGARTVSGLGEVEPDFDFHESIRYWAVSQFPEGISVRGAYWNFEDEATQTTAIGRATDRLEFDVVDLEIGQRFGYGCSELHVLGGVRYARLLRNFSIAPPSPVPGELKWDFDGIGPSIGALLRRPLGCGPFALLGSARGAWLHGDSQISSVGLGIPPGAQTLREHAVQSWEIKLGLEFAVPLYLGGQFVLQAFWEAQSWDWNPRSPLLQEDLAFTGPTLALALYW